MKLLTPTNLGILAATLLAGPLSAQVSTPSQPQPQKPKQQQRPPAPPRGGLRVEIATARVKIPAPPATDAAQQTATPTQQPPKGFPVSGLVANTSREDLAITFTSAEAAERHLSFSLYDSTGNELWNSDAELEDGEDVEAVLPKGKAWKRLVLVPLKIDDTPLNPGVYTVELSVGAGKVVGAAATFEVVESDGQPPVPPAGGNEQGGMQPPPPGNETGSNTDGQQQPPAPPTGGTNGQQQPPPPPTGGTGGQLPPPPPRPGGSNTGGQFPPPPPSGGQQPPQR